MAAEARISESSQLLKASESEFAAIEAALAASERGRRFLDEYVRRRRERDMARLAAALERIETSAREGEAERARACDVVRQLAEVLKELRPLADARLRAREIEARGPYERASGLERRFAALVRLEARDLAGGADFFG